MRGVPRNQPKVSISMQQDQDHQDGRTEVITEPTVVSGLEVLQAKTTFSQDLTILPANNSGEEDQGHYK